MSLKKHIDNTPVHDDLHKRNQNLDEYERDYSCNICYPKTKKYDYDTPFGRFWDWLQGSWPPVEDYSSLTETYYELFERNYKQLQEDPEDTHILVEALKSLGNLFFTLRYRRLPTNTTRDVSYYIIAVYNATEGFASGSTPRAKLKLLQEGKAPGYLEETEQKIHNLIVKWWTGKLTEPAKIDSDQQTVKTTTFKIATVLTSTPVKAISKLKTFNI